MNLPPAQAPEQKARALIDAALVASGWSVQDRETMNLAAGRGVAVREFPLVKAHGFADYLLFIDGKAAGVLEAKKAGHTLVGVETQSRKYTEGFPPKLSAHVLPLPFSYESNGTDTRFTNRLDPEPRSRRVFAVHRPETLAEWLEAETLDAWVKSLHLEGGLFTAADDTRPANVLFFDAKPGADKPWTRTLWVYDFRTNMHFTLKQNRLTRAALDEFVACYRPGERHKRAATWSESNATGRWRAYGYDELMARDKASLDVFWLRDESLEDSASLPEPHVLAQDGTRVTAGLFFKTQHRDAMLNSSRHTAGGVLRGFRGDRTAVIARGAMVDAKTSSYRFFPGFYAALTGRTCCGRTVSLCRTA